MEAVSTANFLTGSGGDGVSAGQPPNVYIVKASPGRLLTILQSGSANFIVYDASDTSEAVKGNIVLQNGAFSYTGPYGVAPGNSTGSTGAFPAVIELNWPMAKGIAISLPDNAGGFVSVSYA